MTRTINAVNPDVLRWARQRAGLTLEQVAKALKKDADTIAAWESESRSQAPTYVQLEKLAYKIYKRPVAIFFFPAPPAEIDPKTEFRLLPDYEIASLDPDTLYAVRRGMSVQESLRELTGGRNPAASKLLDHVDARRYRKLDTLCTRVREHLGIPLEEQMSWGGVGQAFSHWRAAFEDRGIYVFKRSFQQKDISGFCLYDREFPLIYVNNSSSDSRQIFTLFHELAHLLFAASGLTKERPVNFAALAPKDRQIEATCNRFAGAFLVPDSDFRQRTEDLTASDDQVCRLAKAYSVSREVILRKFLDLGRVDQAHYEAKAHEWDEEFRHSRRKGGGNYYTTQATYLSHAFTRQAFATYYAGRCSLQDLAGHLGMKAAKVQKFEDFVTS